VSDLFIYTTSKLVYFLIISFLTVFDVYTVNHKKRDIIFLTITLVGLNRFLQFLYHFYLKEILHAIVVKFTTSPYLCASLLQSLVVTFFMVLCVVLYTVYSSGLAVLYLSQSK